MTPALARYGGLNVRLSCWFEETETLLALSWANQVGKLCSGHGVIFYGTPKRVRFFCADPGKENRRSYDQSHFQDAIHYPHSLLSRGLS
ncbi:hypothetical protein HZS38_14775 [Xenorhabdus nematophila]|uniref:Uncharacterized protein n=1 Tax=Xenorhabdus nematophila (strain ATCC 19061 / DSM 3370 / CCUG 14189 / LMG 1036 / NCIMB 9965 / AN6) TaxID=406817 RepID=D3VG88_XENNA|nr:hypothetical protein [Xenorhabdus nematophila]MBA0020345.1 hypothetical protein [Xenorhabdus nematophila]CBJ88178.1 hypothetical protein XNC1_0090 [Xenorhabdus nematophila ATCC 19061]CEF30977.1 hypothetical protein XNW1_30022 [Xenorhabdus nematophila str. Websteri]CEF33562.1 hypothetical protein XNW1_4800022 [Xenorhabdus nematophila str. Websteri]